MSGQRWLLFLVAVGITVFLFALDPGVRDAEASSYTAVAAGGQHTCAKTTAGGLQCWGNNTWGQRGDGTTVSLGVATAVSGLSSGVGQFDLGTWHSCAVLSTGAVKCWGKNTVGQLGIGEVVSPYRVTAPGAVCISGSPGGGNCVPLTGIAQVSAGGDHTCAVTTAGGVKCWGWNNRGQLGDGTTTTRLNPVDVSGLTSGVASVSAGGNHTCARLTDSSVKCWGNNGYGQLGNGTTTDSSTPVVAAGGVASVSAGGNHSCVLIWFYALVLCWGQNTAGQLGDGTTTNRSTPVYSQLGLGGFGPWVEAGGVHTCARTVSGTVKCWGWNYFGQVGNGSSGDPLAFASSPTNVLGLSAPGDPVASSIAAGDGHNCATTTTNIVKCWGWNEGASPQGEDIDKDGCQDERELGTNASTGGLRNPKYFWDFYDVWTRATPTSPWVRDRVVNQADIDAINARFGATGNPNGDPLVAPTNSTGYHTAYDRGAQTGANPWNRAPPDGNIDLFNDVFGASSQNGHSCL